jgi:hypothetical protein
MVLSQELDKFKLTVTGVTHGTLGSPEHIFLPNAMKYYS